MKRQTFLAVGIFLAALGTGFGQSTLQFSSSTYSVAENAGTATLSVRRLNDTDTVVSVDYATTDGTATNGVKYFSTSGTLAFAAGETNKTFTVPILDEGFVEGTKVFQVLLSNPAGGAMLGTRTNATVSITDNDLGIRFQFAAISVIEDAGEALIGIVRGDNGTNAVTVDYATTDLTATGGLDYTGTTNTLSFAPQERFKFISIPILNDNLKESNETFRMTLSNPVGASLGGQRTITITIVDNDPGFQLEFASYSVSEDAGAVRIGVLRGTDDTNSAVTVELATTDVSATNGLDYLGTTNSVSFAPGDRLKRIAVPILNDGVKQPSKSFRATLSNPTGGAVLGSRTTATVAILDNDPGVGFQAGSYSVWENAGVISVTVLGGDDGDLGPITVDYATSNLTAVAGQDYQSVSGTLTFQTNETIKTIPIPILRNALITHGTRFTVTLSNPTGGATLGTAVTSVNILNAPEPETFCTVAPPFDTALTIRRDGDLNLLTWRGGGPLQKADGPTGPWQTLANATNSFATQSPVPGSFYRVMRPRPVDLFIPSRYDAQTPLPLVILLHGYTYTGAEAEDMMQFRPLAEAKGFLYCYPDSPADRWGYPFWNSTDACCDFGNTGVDDAAYLRALIEEIGSQFAVDRKRIYLIGYSNGGFMAYAMACQSADLIAGIASLAGVTFLDLNRCAPSQPVNILHIHGTVDTTIPYAGGALDIQNFPANFPAFPGARQTVQTWATYNGAQDPVTDSGPSLDLDLVLRGLDTTVTRYADARPGGAVELWTINGADHRPTFHSGSSASEFSPRVIDWLLAHPKP